MNMMGNLGGAAGSYVIGALLLKYQDWNLAFYMSSGVFALGAVCWLFIDPVTSMDDRAPQARAEAA
jgi:hypothetical protein